VKYGCPVAASPDSWHAPCSGSLAAIIILPDHLSGTHGISVPHYSVAVGFLLDAMDGWILGFFKDGDQCPKKLLR
jgi:hypothetical protein